MWSHPQWLSSVYDNSRKVGERLARYAQMFNTVEGNTTFYATPAANTVADWRQAVPDDFRFTFKFPQSITHQQQLRYCQDEALAFLHRMTPLMAQTGLWKIQLPKAFSPVNLPMLAAFLEHLPNDLPIGVEVRHAEFFAKGPAEQALNRLLIESGANRIILDSRPLFAAQPSQPAVIDAQHKKPKVPVHAIATARRPTVRFIGHPKLSANDQFFQQWETKLAQWLASGLQPFVFIHTPDNHAAPELAHRLYHRFNSNWQAQGQKRLPALKALGETQKSNQPGLDLGQL